MLTLGIDDAGRGPIIGPMILAGCLITDSVAEEFKNLGIKDSKQLTPKRREHLAKIIKEKAETFEITFTSPNEIDSSNAEGINLNDLEAIKSAKIINKINKGIQKTKVIIDCPSPNITKWRDLVKQKIDDLSNLEVYCEHKADQNHIACSAASILAKTTRDAEIEKIKEKIGKDFGSGYPSDPKTCKFLEENFEKYRKDGIFRETWSTWKNICKKNEQKDLKGF